MPDDDRISMAKAYQRATRVVTIAGGMVLPGLLGYWLDRLLSTRALFTIVGFGVGMTYGIYDLIRMGQAATKAQSNQKARSNQSDHPEGE